jgi:hypothetical protein
MPSSQPARTPRSLLNASGSEHSSPADRSRDALGLIALGVYLALAAFYFGHGLIEHFRDTTIGMGSDPGLFAWFLQWWPHALTHRLNPFVTDLLWSPHGFNVTWTTCVPLLAVAVWPITAIAGPAAAFNLICLIALPLSGWAAFLLCRRLGGQWWPSLLGGYIFGFSAYTLGQQTCGHIHLTVALFVPLTVLVAIEGITGEFSPPRFLLILTALIVAQFLVCIEVFATMTMFAAMALLLGHSFAPPDVRRRILRALPYLAGAYLLALIVVSPYLYYMLAYHAPQESRLSYSTDLLNLIVPAPTQALGAIPAIARLSATFRLSAIAEVDAYVGPPLLILFAIYVWGHWREPLCRLLAEMFLVVCVLSFGARLHAGGHELFRLPGIIFGVLPILDKLVPSRFMAFGFLILAIATARWFSASPIGIAPKIGFAILIVLFTLPNFSSQFWLRPLDTPAFFATPAYRQYLRRDENVLIVPFGMRGDSMRWQGETGYYFRLAGGWTGFTEPEFARWPIVDALLDAAYLPDPAAQLRAFMAAHGVAVVIVSDNGQGATNLGGMLAGSWSAHERVGGISLYRAAPNALDRFSGASALSLAQRADTVLFDRLLLIADRWITAGGKLAELTPFDAQRAGLLPADWLIGPGDLPEWVTGTGASPIDTSQHFFAGAYLGITPDGHLGVGVSGYYAAIAPIVARYRTHAVHAYFLLASRTDLMADGVALPDPDKSAPMVMLFDPSQVASAASIARTELAGLEMTDKLDGATPPVDGRP